MPLLLPNLDDRRWLEVTHGFHSMVCRMSGNPLLNLLAGALKDIYTDRVSGYVFPKENRDHVCETHGAIAEAIVVRDAATAERLMHDHMATLAEFFEFRNRGLIKVGYIADLVAFDPETVGSKNIERVRDFPAGAERLIAQSVGIEHIEEVARPFPILALT